MKTIINIFQYPKLQSLRFESVNNMLNLLGFKLSIYCWGFILNFKNQILMNLQPSQSLYNNFYFSDGLKSIIKLNYPQIEEKGRLRI